MTDDLAVLRSSLADRAHALDSYLEELKADLGRSDESFRQALDVCRAYTRAFVKQLDRDWSESVGREECRRILNSSLESFLEREQWIDQRFARSSQGDVPRALKTIAREQFRGHALGGHEPVVTVGPPVSFETQLASLAEFLFEDVHVLLDEEDDALRSKGANLSIFCAPYIEGTRVLWYPIVVGHEIAHVRLERGSDVPTHKDIVRGWLQERDVAFSNLLDDLIVNATVAAKTRLELNEQLLDWTTELICDLNAVRLFGPAGLSAIAEFLSILESQSQTGMLDTKTHPPLPIRLEVMFEFLRQTGWDDTVMPSFAEVWQEQIGEARPQLDMRARSIADVIRKPSHVQQLIDFVKSWDDVYRADENRAAIDLVASELLDGVPGTTHVPGRSGTRETTIFDVVNGTWVARRALDDKESGIEVQQRGELIDSRELQAQEKRLRLDSLASKAIDTLELSRLWGSERGVIAASAIREGQPLQGETRAGDAPPNGSVLSRRVLAKSLVNSVPGSRERMVVTPLFEDSIRDAAIDLRLGPDFIVFRHSATTAFDPLGRGDHDPRTMQERVHKGWGERFILHPQELVLASTLEFIVLPGNVAAQVLTRSSYGRLGLLTATAVQVQPGSRGCITLELVNQGETPIALSPGVRVAQLMLWLVAEPCQVVPGKYWFPVGPEFSKVSEDPDATPLQNLSRAAREPVESTPTRLLVRTEGSGRLGDEFLDIARKLGGTDVREPTASTRDAARVGPELAPVIVAIAMSIRILATTVQRWQQGRNPGVIIEVVEGRAVVRIEQNLPSGTVVICGDKEREISLNLPPNSIDDVAAALRSFMR
jgi:deoxycytidine triphosphate deaminase